ncbi:MAG: dephospho-CoA kinase [Bacteroidales bacterium]|nr:dephospho-CoA kinase [Bacteroidales bacterium]
MKILGLTGGIGSGKSVVAELFRVMGVPVYDSDARSKVLTDTDEDLKKGLVALFGPELYSNGLLNRSALASRIFADEEALKAANALIHPAVTRDFMIWAEDHSLNPLLVMESAILFEAGLEHLFDRVVCVTAPEDLRIERVCKRNGLTPDAVRSRIHHQLSDKERISRSDIIIVNDGIQALLPQVRKIIDHKM